ncbi:hypothetical protein [Streptomyces cyaneofuscatus]|uniref:hypothetical protein n=1 Tax=Streptomyces cyaneofuscatus TaxID=66883 RepID=UPI0037A6E297
MRVVGGRDGSTMRLLPWTGTGGKPCYVVGDGTGYVSRKADEVEDIQLDMADELLGHAADLLAEAETEAHATAPQLHFLASRLRESSEQVRRIAESRGSRLEAALARPAPPQPPVAPPQSNSETSP